MDDARRKGTGYVASHVMFCKKSGHDPDCPACAEMSTSKSGAVSLPPKPDPFDRLTNIHSDIGNLIKMAHTGNVIYDRASLRSRLLTDAAERAEKLHKALLETVEEICESTSKT